MRVPPLDRLRQLLKLVETMCRRLRRPGCDRNSASFSLACVPSLAFGSESFARKVDRSRRHLHRAAAASLRSIAVVFSSCVPCDMLIPRHLRRLFIDAMCASFSEAGPRVARICSSIFKILSQSPTKHLRLRFTALEFPKVTLTAAMYSSGPGPEAKTNTSPP